MNAIVRQAEAAITDKRFESQPGLCQRFARQVVQAVCGHQYDAMMKGTARESAIAAERLGWTAKGLPQAGDLLYRRTGAGGAGHVGIYAGNGVVIDNSSSKSGRISGAKGRAALAQFRYDTIVRLACGEAPCEGAQCPLEDDLEGRRERYGLYLEQPLRQLYDGLPKALPGEAGRPVLAALNALNRELVKAGSKD